MERRKKQRTLTRYSKWKWKL